MLLCPLCARALRTVERQGIEIDHCTHCGGFWLDAGELDALIRQEADLALQAGQQALRLARNDREYDRKANEFGISDPLGGASSVLRRAATTVSTRSR